MNTDCQDMMDQVVEVAAKAFRERVEAMGEKESGAYEFYVSRLDRNLPLVPHERALIDAIDPVYPKETTFYELGAGVGMLALALAARGYHGVAVECDQRRIDAALSIRDRVAAVYPEVAARFWVKKVLFGKDTLDRVGPPRNQSIAVCTNFVNGWSHKNSNILCEEIKIFDEFIIDMLLFGINRTRDQVSEVFSLFSDIPSSVFLDLGFARAALYQKFVPNSAKQG